MNPDRAKIIDTPGYARDTNSKAIVSVDRGALQAYKARRTQQEEMNRALSDINMLKQELTEIKDLLLSVVKREV